VSVHFIKRTRVLGCQLKCPVCICD